VNFVLLCVSWQEGAFLLHNPQASIDIDNNSLYSPLAACVKSKALQMCDIYFINSVGSKTNIDHIIIKLLGE